MPRGILFLIALGGAALFLRGCSLLESQRCPQLAVPALDARFYTQAAQQWARGEAPAGVHFMSPGYTALAGTAAWLESRGREPPGTLLLWLQVVLSSAGCVVVAVVAGRWSGRAAGVAAGLLLALHGTDVFYSVRVLPAAPAAFLTALVLLALVGLERGATAPRMLVLGLLLGVQATLRANVLLAAALLTAALAFEQRRAGWRNAQLTGALAAGILLPLAPFAWHNWHRGGDAVLLTSSGGVNLYIGNHRGSDGRFLSLNQLPLAPGHFADDPTGGEFERSVAAYAERAESRSLRPSEVSRFWARQALAEVRADPGAWLLLELRKLFLLGNAFEIPQIDNLYFLADRGYLTALSAGLVFTSRLLLPLALFGLIAHLAGARRRWPALVYGAGLAASLLLFFVNARYREPLAPLLAVAAGAGVAALGEAARRRRLALPAVGLAACAVVTNLAPQSFAPDPAASGPRAWFVPSEEYLDYEIQHNNMAARCLERGDGENAEAELRAGLALDPLHPHPTLLYQLGRTLLAKGDTAGAAEALVQSLARAPANPDAAVLLARVQYEAGHPAAAAATLERTVAAGGSSAELCNLLGAARSRAGDDAGAVAALEEAIRRKPGWVEPQYNLGLLFLKAERHAEAAAVLEPLYRRSPGAPVDSAFATALVGLGRLDEAEPLLVAILESRADTQALLSLADLSLQRGDTPRARALLEKAPDTTRTRDLRRRLGEDG